METQPFKNKLEEELALVEQELGELAHEDIDLTATEKDEIADRFEEAEVHDEETKTLKGRQKDIKDALERIENGTYGVCEECGSEIEKARLEANPAARTCTAHM